MSNIEGNLASVRDRIATACLRAGRDMKTVELIAVSKTVPADAVREVVESGLVLFGESRLQEAEPKIEVLPGNLQWHFIGRMQRNKVRRILPLFDLVHGVDSLRLASHINEVARDLGLFPKLLLQVNVGGEETKGGFEPDVLRAEMKMLLELERLEILGLMCIPPATRDAEASRPWFSALREQRGELEKQFKVSLPFLSMGMSGDFEIAVEEGATHVRVGSSIFGKRAYRVDGELG